MKKTKKLLMGIIMLFLVLTAVIAIPKSAQAADSDFVIENGVLTKYNGSGGKVVVPDGVTEIGDWAFLGCGSLTEIVIPNGVTKIGDWAFLGCGSLTEIVIPKSVTEIGGNAFRGTPWLGSKGNERADYLVIVNSILIDGEKASEKVVIPDGVTKIGNYAFQGRNLKDIEIPKSVVKIGEYAFNGTGIQKISIPANVKEIFKGAFGECNNLTEITILNPETKLWVDDDISQHIFQQTPKGRTFEPFENSALNNEFNGNDGIGPVPVPPAPDSDNNFIEDGILTLKGYKGSTTEKLADYLKNYKYFYYGDSFTNEDGNGNGSSGNRLKFKTFKFVALDGTSEGDSNVTTNPNNPSKPNGTTKPAKTSSANAKALLKKVKVTKSLSIKRKKSKTIKVTLPKGLKKVTKYTNKSGQVKITYKSNKKKTATVTSKGKVTAKRKGTAKITTTVRLKNGTKKTFTTKVKVK